MSDVCSDLKIRLLEPGARFTIEEAKAIADRIYHECRIDMRDRFHNIFFYEICPFISIAERVSGKKTLISFTGSASRFDGLILFGDDRKAQRVEMTAAIDGHNDALQMELLDKRGHAPAFQKIEFKGTKHNRMFGPNQTNAIRPDEYNFGTLLPRMKRAFRCKANKTTNNQHYVGAWLGIVFDDNLSPRNQIEKKKRFDPVCGQVLRDVRDEYNPFSRVFFVGVSRQYFFDSANST